MKKRVFLFVFILSLVFSFGYMSLPDHIILTENSEIRENGIISYASKTDTETVGETTVQAELFGTIPLKTVDVSVLPEKNVLVSGETVGIRIYSDGIMVVEVENKSGAKSAGVKPGDIIEKINGDKVESTEEVKVVISENETNTLNIKRDKTSLTLKVTGKWENDGYKAGMWIRDSAAGIGTMTYVDENGNFGALGHAICDATTEDIVPIKRGSVADCEVKAVRKGKVSEPGEIEGVMSRVPEGTVTRNTELGVFGTTGGIKSGIKMPVATRYSIRQGKAEIFCNVDGAGVKSYEIEITSVSKSSKVNNKGIEIKVTDPELLDKTGGIVQGMSGSPIVQNGKLIGAVTHVFVNDPARGYGIFIEYMLDVTR